MNAFNRAIQSSQKATRRVAGSNGVYDRDGVREDGRFVEGATGVERSSQGDNIAMRSKIKDLIVPRSVLSGFDPPRPAVGDRVEIGVTIYEACEAVGGEVYQDSGVDAFRLHCVEVSP